MQNRKDFEPRFVVFWVAVAALAFLLSARTANAANPAWHSLSQSVRNNAIVNKACSQLGWCTGMQCKEWAQNIVWSASCNEVWIPQNCGYTMWYYDQYSYRMPTPFPISWTSPGQIIQMAWQSSNGCITPHTAIVLSKTSSGMYWIDCNWSCNFIVQIHYVSYAQWNSAVGYNYSVYEIH